MSKKLTDFIKENLYNRNLRFEGQRLNKSYFEKRNYIDIWKQYNSLFKSEEKMFIYLRDNGLPLYKCERRQFFNECKICGSKTEFIGRTKGYKNFCSKKCHSKSISIKFKNKTAKEKKKILLKIENTNLVKYGVKNVMQNEQIKIKAINTILSRSNEYKEKIAQKDKNTKLKKYGNENYNNPEKSKETCLKKYGVKYSFQSENNKNKSKQTWYKKYGCHISCSPIIKNKIRKTNEINGNWLPKNKWSDFKTYKAEVWKITNKVKHLLKNFSKTGNKLNDYHCDHRYSIYQGFKDNIPTFIIGNLCNLEMINSRTNMSKNIKCSISKEELFNEFYNKNNK